MRFSGHLLSYFGEIDDVQGHSAEVRDKRFNMEVHYTKLYDRVQAQCRTRTSVSTQEELPLPLWASLQILTKQRMLKKALKKY